ncbi:MAG TPA: hypothetical protein VGN37_25250 [Actinocatenispora sp.]
MGQYDANPEELARRTEVLEGVAKGVKAVFDDHQARLDRIGNVWGTDELGVQFSSRYVPTSKDFTEYTHNLTVGVQTSVDEVVHTAERIKITEERNVTHTRHE